MNDSTESKKAGGGSSRLKVQLLILGVLVIGLIYEYAVAQPAVNEAYDRMAEESVRLNAKGADPTTGQSDVFTNVRVQELLDKEPSRTFEEPNGDLVEVYSWRRGLPFLKHDLFAVYKKNGNDWMFYRHAKFEHESSTAVSKYDGKSGMMVQLDGSSPPDPQAEGARRAAAEAAESGQPAGPGPTAGPGGGGGPGRGGPGGGGGFDPAAMFANADSDGDGMLTGDEIPQRSRDNLAEIDTDGDQSISEAEWTVRMEAVRAQFGAGGRGGQGGGGQGGGGRPRGESSRPEVETEDESAPPDQEAEPAVE